MPPLPTQSTCVVCMEAPPSPNEYDATNSLCASCVRQIFSNALADEAEYPAHLGPRTLLELSHYRRYLDDELITAYEHRELEYGTHPVNRVYCGCEVFVGSLVKSMPSHIKVTASCPKGCQKVWCLICATEIDAERRLDDHDCVAKLNGKSRERTLELESLVRGVHYQLCPTCGRRVQLSEACNHITCPCTENFCYACGEPASESSAHWSIGRCPRYGPQPRHDREPRRHRDLGGIPRAEALRVGQEELNVFRRMIEREQAHVPGPNMRQQMDDDDDEIDPPWLGRPRPHNRTRDAVFGAERRMQVDDEVDEESEAEEQADAASDAYRLARLLNSMPGARGDTTRPAMPPYQPTLPTYTPGPPYATQTAAASQPTAQPRSPYPSTDASSSYEADVPDYSPYSRTARSIEPPAAPASPVYDPPSPAAASNTSRPTSRGYSPTSSANGTGGPFTYLPTGLTRDDGNGNTLRGALHNMTRSVFSGRQRHSAATQQHLHSEGMDPEPSRAEPPAYGYPRVENFPPYHGTSVRRTRPTERVAHRNTQFFAPRSPDAPRIPRQQAIPRPPREPQTVHTPREAATVADATNDSQQPLADEEAEAVSMQWEEYQ